LSPAAVCIVAFVVFLILLFLRMPIAFAFAIAGFGGFVYLKGIGPALSLLGSAPYGWASSSSLIPLPLFVLMGQLAFHSGISRDLYETAYRWIGRFPGGLAMTTVLACTGFAACTGSSVAGAATMGTIAMPEMRKYNYSPYLATGAIASGGTLGILIPPSTIFIIYGYLTGTSIGSLFIAGILPGLLLSGIFLILIYLRCRLNPRLGPPMDIPASWRERLTSLRGAAGMLFLFFLVIGGLYGGIFAPSEAGAIGALGACLFALFRRRLTWRVLISCLRDTAKITSFALVILIGAMIFGAFLAHSGIPSIISQWVVRLPISPYLIVAGVIILYIPLGMAMDALPMILLTMPVIFPAIIALGFNPVWFGVLVVISAEMALISPPVGINVFVVQGVCNEPLHVVFRGVIPFILVMIVCLAILVAFPQIAMFLPNSMY
jgi:C4-dicarboxylate transporter DctM subunit